MTISRLAIACVVLAFVAILFTSISIFFESAVVVAPTQHTLRDATLTAIHLLFVGDIMLDRTVADHAKTHRDDSLFAHVETLFQDTDAVVANLEGIFSDTPSISQKDHSILRFTFDPRFAFLLKNLGINVVSLSNNHTDDFYGTGLLQTKRTLSDAGISYFGSPDNTDLSNSITLHDKNVCFVGYQEFIHADLAPVLTEIARIRPTCDFLVFTMHAGIEYSSTYSKSQQRIAHASINAGADLVIGTHPHVVQPLEIYKNKAIFYSLGNFMFDQNFSFETTHGLAVRLTWGDNTTTYSLIPTTIAHQEASIASSSDAAKTLRSLFYTELPPEVISSITRTHSFTLK